jgi:ribonuclease D
MAAVTRGVRRGHGPIPKPENGGGRRRMDRRAERLLDRLKRWRARRASELEMDPGVLCPNSTLEAIVLRDPARLNELAELPEVKGWFAREIGPEVLDVLAQAAAEPE